MMSWRPSLRPVVLAVVVGLSMGAAGLAHADEEDTPLYLSVAHSITRDSNFSRDSRSQGETVNVTALQAGIDKAYGRQTYRGSAKVSKYNYAYYGDTLNNDGKDLDGTFSSEFLRDWRVTADGTYTENLNQVTDNNDAANRVVRNIRTYRDGNLAVQYGIGGLYSLTAQYDANKLKYSAPTYRVNDANQHTTGLRATYNSTDMLNFGLGYRLVRTHFVSRADDESQKDRNIDFTTNWQVSGLSNLNATLTRRNTVYSSDPDRTVRGWTGGLNWLYTPSGLMTYGVGLQRATGADRTKNDKLIKGTLLSSLNTDNNNVSTTLDLSARMKVTGKVNAYVAYNLTRYAIDNQNVGTVPQCTVNGSGVIVSCVAVPGDSSDRSSSMFHSTTLGMNYAATRAISLGCSYKRYDQSPGANRIAYDGHSVDCSASLTID
ncbi:hypothetical protein [Aquabacterium sp.]|uniref:hypothetical protein n=1 Tax=Aquabacterium sp. TaxID=1872578 RepID=UPI002E36EAA5|nr:hypothetical protein [Aquabacterium sp.]